ncbi:MULTISPECIES: DNA repair protein RecN [Clostridia]|uniref:DNA repair protein RecN n=2 Tax=Clostridia TaxID=186801 RepID=A0A8I0DNH4_9CLOT|nr:MULTISPECIES: DNA repair protein RecN [Clostridia]MBC5640165.1 DNA repair protein RecN [Clostridium lentum]MBC5654383.1 DNA repair protein RecN [Blautia lenta]CDB75551.1 dNA repair protein RecN [Clostridium sp. CAG:265]
MLVVLNIKNFALIQELSVEFGAGFNILSGETGAGKSILIDTIDYVLGGKFSKELIRYGEDKTYVEAIFDMENNEIYTLLNDLNIENDELLVVSRETTISGKSIIKVNGKTIVLSQLKRIREKLLDIHGQHQNQSLLSKGTHILYLDEYNSENISPLLEQFEIVKNRHSQIEDKINELKGNDDREKILDYIKFQIDDIEKAKLKPGEEEDLREQYNILANAEKISSSLINSYNYLNNNPQGNSVLELLSKVISEFSHSEMHLEKIKDKRVQVEEAYYLLEESTRDIRDIANEIYYDENELAAINERIYEISLYKKKYGDSIDEILKFLEKLKNQYDEFINSEEIILNLKKELSVIEKDMSEIGVKLHEFRCMSAKDLEVRIKEELSYVGLEKAIIKIDVNLSEIANNRGYDDVQFLISANPGEPLKPLEKVLSGGELSRIMLALKCVFVDKDKIPTLIFDEIDTGISGAIGKRVGEKMYQVSVKHQVLCITHLPQIAALSDNHYFVSKKVENGKTFTQIRMLNEQDKVCEIAKMIGGDNLSDVAIDNSREMVKLANIKKNEIKNEFI